MGAQGLGRYELDPATEKVFEQKGEFHKMVECFRTFLELHQQVHIGIAALLAAGEGAEHPQPPHAQGEQGMFVISEDLFQLFSVVDHGPEIDAKFNTIVEVLSVYQAEAR